MFGTSSPWGFALNFSYKHLYYLDFYTYLDCLAPCLRYYQNIAQITDSLIVEYIQSFFYLGKILLLVYLSLLPGQAMWYVVSTCYESPEIPTKHSHVDILA